MNRKRLPIGIQHFQNLIQEGFLYELPIPEFLQRIREWYNGYSWDGKNRLYNPFSILNFMSTGTFDNYWFSTGTPTFLVKALKQQKIDVLQLGNLHTSLKVMDTADFHRMSPMALLLQTGYLTIRAVEQTPFGGAYTLSYPNKEVELSLQNMLLSEYLDTTPDVVDSTITYRIYTALKAGELKPFFEILNQTLASIPYTLFNSLESYYHSIAHVMLRLTGMTVRSEELSNKGRADSIVETDNFVYIFEFKLDTPPEKAIAQIRENGYAEPFRNSGKAIYGKSIEYQGWEMN